MRRAPMLEQDLNEQLGGAAGEISERKRAALHDQGRALSLDGAVEQALALCEDARALWRARSDLLAIADLSL